MVSYNPLIGQYWDCGFNPINNAEQGISQQTCGSSNNLLLEGQMSFFDAFIPSATTSTLIVKVNLIFLTKPEDEYGIGNFDPHPDSTEHRAYIEGLKII